MVSFVEEDIIDSLSLCDFGTAAVFGEESNTLSSRTIIGTGIYIAPEIIKLYFVDNEDEDDKVKAAKYNPFKSDCRNFNHFDSHFLVFSFGMTLRYMIIGKEGKAPLREIINTFRYFTKSLTTVLKQTQIRDLLPKIY